MKSKFKEPTIEVIRFVAEDVITSSGMRAEFGMNPGFDETEPNGTHVLVGPMLPPCV